MAPTSSRAASSGSTTSAPSTARTCSRGTPSSSRTPPRGWASTRSAWRRSPSILNRHGRAATDLVVKFLEHFALISEAMKAQGLWDEEDGFYYDRLRRPGRLDDPGEDRTRWSACCP